MINWLFSFFGYCRKHRVRTEWDGAKEDYVCPVCESLAELSRIDAVMARRPALDLPTRAANVEKAINVASKCDAAERDRVILANQLHWALDIMAMYERRLIDFGDPAARVHATNHVARFNEARAQAAKVIPNVSALRMS